MEFWTDMTTDKSWKVLLKISKELKFIVIGGWACYLHTKSLKSKDIDIIVDFPNLSFIKEKFDLKKTNHLKKYETIIDEISIDIYVSYYSKLILPLTIIQQETEFIDNIRVPKAEVLLILKQQAEFERKNTLKGQKDRVDILSLLMKAKIDWENYFKLIKENNLENYWRRLKEIIISAKKEFLYFGIKDPREIKLIKQKLLKKISQK